MQIVHELVVKSKRHSNDGSYVVKLTKDEKFELMMARINELTDEYNGIYKESKKYRAIPNRMVIRAREILMELKMLKAFTPRVVHTTKKVHAR